MMHTQVGIPVGAGIFGTAFTFLGVLAARRDERLFKEQAAVCFVCVILPLMCVCVCVCRYFGQSPLSSLPYRLSHLPSPLSPLP